MSRLVKNFILFLIGGAVYYGIELLWRGYSHPAMLIVGGLCFLSVGGINNLFGWDLQLPLQVLIGVFVVTATEFVAGCILNLWLRLDIWSYSDLPLNVLGQISAPYILLWIPLTLIAILFDDRLRYKLFGEERPRYRLGKYAIETGGA